MVNLTQLITYLDELLMLLTPISTGVVKVDDYINAFKTMETIVNLKTIIGQVKSTIRLENNLLANTEDLLNRKTESLAENLVKLNEKNAAQVAAQAANP